MRRLKKQLALFALLSVSVFYSGLPSLAADRQLVIAPVKAAPEGEKRLALIIGNSAYKTSPLRNPVNDARAIGKALSATGFKVTVLEDASQAAMRRAIRTFGDELQQSAGVGVFYYAGHGMQVKGKNYLIPVNADIEREDEIEDQAVDANVMLAKMDSAKNSLNLVILDACRNNPFARSYRSSAAGLAQMDAPSGTLIAFATSPGSVAADGDGENGLYTKHLLANINRPGLPIEQLFKEVRIGVTKDTKDRQVPWESSSLKGNFFFVPGEAALSAEDQRRQIEKQVSERVAAERAQQQKQMEQMIQQMLAAQKAALEEDMRKRGEAVPAAKPAPQPEPVAAPAPAPAPVDKNRMELAFWDSMKGSSNPEDFKAYLDQYPQGTFAALARNRLNALKPAPVIAPAPAPAPAAPAPIVALKPIEPPKPAPAAAPVQVASAAPTSMIGLGIDDPRFPKIGDLWEYRYIDTTTKQSRQARFEVTAVSPAGILESGGFADARPASRAHSQGMHLVHKEMWDLSPYLLSFGSPKPGETFNRIPPQGNVCMGAGVRCTFDAKVVGMEKVTTPAGTYDALKVVVEVNIGGFDSRWRQITFWYAEATKRLVKSSVRTLRGSVSRYSEGMTYDYDFELTSYVPAAQRTPSGANVQVASAARVQTGGFSDPRYPKVGDYWEYRYLDVVTKVERKARLEVATVDKDAIADTLNDESQRSYTKDPKLSFNRMWLELSPYMPVFGLPEKGQPLRGFAVEHFVVCQQAMANCQFQGAVEGVEKVATAAGQFEATKIVVDMQARLGGNAWRQYTFWYSAAAKRLVKASARTRSGNPMEPDYDVELLSYKLN